MKVDPIAALLAALPDARRTGQTQYSARCPAHDDTRASLSIGVKPDGTVGLHCHAGCDSVTVCDALGLTLADLFPKDTGKRSKRTASRRAVAALATEEWDEAWQAAKRLGPSALSGFALAAVYPYRDATGKTWGWRARYESKSGEKQIKPFHHDGSEWVLKEPAAPRKGKPLYRLPEVVATDGAIFVVEGEKCADALAAIGIAATTSGAAKSAAKADWTPLAGRTCIIWPDNDDPGDQYAADVIEALAKLDAEVRLIDVAALDLRNMGDDAADWLASNPTATAADVLALPTLATDSAFAGVTLIRGSDIEPEPIDWLWEGWLARGMLALLAGDPGAGKTTLALTIAAAITTGGQLPDGTTAQRGNVLMWTGEDALAQVLVPRLREAGADVSRVLFVAAAEGHAFDPAHDMPALEQRAQSLGDVALVIIDPMVSAVAGDSHKNAEVRRGLQPLMTLAENVGAAVLGITHFAKNTTGRKTTERIIGSVAFSAVARVAMVAAMGADGEGRLVRSKSNIGPSGDGFGYSIEITEQTFRGKPAKVSSVSWGGLLFGRADELLGQIEGKRQPRDEAADWLSAALQNGPITSKELKVRATEDGMAWRTIERAKVALNVVAERKATSGKARGSGEWIWRLPKSAREAAEVTRRTKFS